MSTAAQHSSTADVVVVGAGLAGLACALHLQARGLHTVVVEASDEPGGRVRTDIVDGFRLDRGFQLYNPAYPEGKRVFDYPALNLRAFERGARVMVGTTRYRVGDPRSHPTWIADVLRAPLGSLPSLLRLAWYALSCSTSTPAALRSRPDVALSSALADSGVSERTIDRLLTPFLSGVFLEPHLDTSRLFGDLVLRSFIRGTPAVPADGMQALPDQLARQVVDLRLSCPVEQVRPGRVSTLWGPIQAPAVVVAVDPASVADLLPTVRAPSTRSCTTWYHVPDQPPGALSDGEALLTIDASGRSPLVNTAVMTHAAPSYAPPGRSLVSSTSLGVSQDVTEEEVRRELSRLYGVPTHTWECIGTYRVDPALPSMDPPLQLRKPVALGDGLFVAGDHRDTASIQGALVSGRRAAEAVIGHLHGSTDPA